MDIALTFDDRYAIHALVTIQSILAHNPNEQLRFWLGLETAKDKPTSPAWSHLANAATVNWLVIDDLDGEVPVSDASPYLSRAACLRLFLPHVVPTDVVRLLYVDCDVLCRTSLIPLVETDLKGKSVAAVRDAYMHQLCDGGHLAGLRDDPHIDPRAPYFNSGVLLIDTDQWRQREVASRAWELAQRSNRYPDQDALNIALYGDWEEVPKFWNYMFHWRLEPYNNGRLEDAGLIHCVGSKKYWSENWSAKYDEDSVVRRLYWNHRAVVDGLGGNAATGVRGRLDLLSE